ncbi:MAG: hypothetical protein EXR72_02070 [Myxococcales bacterium]|nr:hypothetical protein [Myxococcales bacterium]
MPERRLQVVPDALIRTYVSEAGWAWVAVPEGRAEGRGRVVLDLADRVLCDLADGGRRAVEHRREVEGMLGRPFSAREFEERVARLVDDGVLRDGSDGFSAPDSPWLPNLLARPLDPGAPPALDPAPGARFACDGRGACCGTRDRIPLDADDVAGLHAAYPDDEPTPGGLTAESALRPDSDRPGLFLLAVRDGDCMALQPDSRCGIHARLGRAAKPAGCRLFPLTAVLAAGTLHVGLRLECRCAIDSAATGDPITAPAEELRARLLISGDVEEVAETIAATCDDRRWPRETYLAWRTAASARAAATTDPLAFAIAEAARLSGKPPPPWRAFALLAAAIERRLAIDARDAARVYAPSDQQLAALAWGAEAATHLQAALRDGGPAATPQTGERLLVAQVLHTHDLLRARSLSVGLCALALRLALARAGAEVALPAALLPIAAAELLFRQHGLAEACDQAGMAIDEALHGPEEAMP